MGLTFPASSALVAEPGGRVATNAGALLAANTAGAIVGTFVVPFVLIPAIGSSASVGIIALINVLVGVGLATRGRIARQMPRTVVSVTGGIVTLVIVVGLIEGSVFVDPSIRWIESHGGTVFESTEDEIASVQAGELDGYKQLWVTGTSMTILTVDTKLMPVLPLMLRPQSTSALVIAFGMGSAFRSALVAGLHTDVVELVPSVPDMFPNFYTDAEQVRADPNGQVIIADGRNHVELTDKHYDIVVVDPPPPIESAGVSVISSLEFYEASKARLTDGGVMMQWVPYGQTLDEFKAHVRTFSTVFPNVMIAGGPGGFGYYMLGSSAPISFSPAAIQEVLARPGVLADISSAVDSPRHDEAGWEALIPNLVRLSGSQVGDFAGQGPLVTDDRPFPEYFLLRHLFGAPSPALQPSMVAPP